MRSSIVCDQVCNNLFSRTALAWRTARQWASRRRPFVRRAAVAASRRIAKLDFRAARWIAADALRELTAPATRSRLAKR